MAALNTGSVDDDVQAPQQLYSLMEACFPLLRVGQVHLEAVAAVTLAAKIRRYLLYLVRRAENYNLRTGFQQPLRHTVSQTASTASYDCLPVLNIKQIRHKAYVLSNSMI